MKRTTASAAMLVVAAAVVAVWTVLPTKKHDSAPSYAFAMCVAHGASMSSSPWSTSVLASVARTFAPEERKALEEALATSTTRWEARANPLLEDLEDAEPDAALDAWFKKAPSFVRTASAAMHPSACAADGFCALPRRDAACPPGWSPAANDDEAARARFIAWPWGHALRLRAASEADAMASAALLRSRIRTSSRIALVLSPDDDAATGIEPFIRLRELWKRHGTLRAIARGEHGAPEHAPATDGGFDPVTPADRREIVILPRLATISDDAALEAEVLDAAPRLEKVVTSAGGT